jgi:hypothetical protein
MEHCLLKHLLPLQKELKWHCIPSHYSRLRQSDILVMRRRRLRFKWMTLLRTG